MQPLRVPDSSHLFSVYDHSLSQMRNSTLGTRLSAESVYHPLKWSDGGGGDGGDGDALCQRREELKNRSSRCRYRTAQKWCVNEMKCEYEHATEIYDCDYRSKPTRHDRNRLAALRRHHRQRVMDDVKQGQEQERQQCLTRPAMYQRVAVAREAVNSHVV